MPAQEVNIAPHPIFSGDKQDKDFLSAREFLLEVDARKARGDNNDVEIIQWAASCFRGTALMWFRYTLPQGHSDAAGKAALGLVKTNYLAFRRAFAENFQIGGETKKIYWTDVLNQRKGETATAFYNRAMAGLGEHLHDADTKLASRDKFAATDLQYNAHTAGIADQGDRDAARTALNGGVAALWDSTLEIHEHILHDLFQRRILIDGLHNHKLREAAERLLKDYPRNPTLWAKIAQEEQRILHPGNPVTVNVVDNTQDVSAVRGKPKGKPKRHRDNSLSCNFCHRKGHLVSDCRQKANADAGRPHSILAVTASAPPPAQQAASAAPGNAGGW